MLAVIAIVIVRLTQIVQHANYYSDHVHQVESLIEKAKQNSGSKFTVDFAAP
jgi:hypothetical protein